MYIYIYMYMSVAFLPQGMLAKGMLSVVWSHAFPLFFVMSSFWRYLWKDDLWHAWFPQYITCFILCKSGQSGVSARRTLWWWQEPQQRSYPHYLTPSILSTCCRRNASVCVYISPPIYYMYIGDGPPLGDSLQPFKTDFDFVWPLLGGGNP